MISKLVTANRVGITICSDISHNGVTSAIDASFDDKFRSIYFIGSFPFQ